MIDIKAEYDKWITNQVKTAGLVDPWTTFNAGLSIGQKMGMDQAQPNILALARFGQVALTYVRLHHVLTASATEQGLISCNAQMNDVQKTDFANSATVLL